MRARKLMTVALLSIMIICLVFVFVACEQEEGHKHEYSAEWTYDEYSHWHKATCEHTEEIKDKEEHSWGEGETVEEPTHNKEGLKKYTCSICSAVKEEILPQKHNYELKEEWEKDENYHWHELICVDCGDKKEHDKSEHSWDNGEIIEDATCSNTGIVEYTCNICSAVKEEIIPQKHNYELKEEWEKDENYHWHELICVDCGDKKKQDKSEHSWDSYDTCKKCNYDNSDGIKFKINIEKTEYAVVGIKSDNRNSEIIIPSEYKGLPITSIGDSAFSFCSSVTSIEIPSSVTSIGYRAFSGCSSLTSITFGDNPQLISIGDRAFYGCISLTSI